MNRIAGCPWKFGSVMGVKPLSLKNNDDFSVKILHVGRGIWIGVCSELGTGLIGDDETSWAIESVHGNVGHNNKWKDFST